MRVLERRLKVVQLIYYAAESPHVRLRSVRLGLACFRSHVVGGPEKLGQPLMRPNSARYTEVDKFDINALIAEILPLHGLLDIFD